MAKSWERIPTLSCSGAVGGPSPYPLDPFGFQGVTRFLQGSYKILKSLHGHPPERRRPPQSPPKSTSKSDLEKGRLLSSKRLPSGPPRRPQNPQNPSPEASQKASSKKSRTSDEQIPNSDPLDLPKPGEGSQKSHFSGFRKRSPNGAPKASLLEAFWAPKSPKSRSGRVSKKHSKIGAPNDSSRL